jgi:hypothetical protein
MIKVREGAFIMGCIGTFLGLGVFTGLRKIGESS